MTREDAQIYIRDLLTGHNEECTTNHYWDVARGVDKIFDEFESRTCENCTHMKQVSENNKWCDLLEQYNLKYCSEFVSTDTKGE